MKTLSVPALAVLDVDLPDDADPQGVAELVDVRASTLANSHGRLVDAAFAVPRLGGRTTEVEHQFDQRVWAKINWRPEPSQKPPRGYNLAKLGNQIQSGELSERDLLIWAWVYALNGGRTVTFLWHDQTLNLGGSDALARGLGTLVRLGWVTTSEDPDVGSCTVTPTPGKSAIR